MRSIIKSVVAAAAALFTFSGVYAAPTIVSPADYSTVQTLTDTMKGYLADSDFIATSTPYFSSANTATRDAYADEYAYSNSVPVKLTWSGTSGECTVKLWRTNKDTDATPVVSATVDGTSLKCYDLEIGRNYTWTVTDATGTATGHFYTDGTAPRIILSDKDLTVRGADCSNGRDIGGWLTADGTKRVKQGLIFRSAYLEYCNSNEVYQVMTYLQDTIGIKLDIDLRTSANVELFAEWPAAWNNNEPLDDILTESSIGPNVVRCCIENATEGLGPSGNGIEFPSQGAFVASMTNKKGETQTATHNKIAVWTAFNKIYESAITKGEPVIFHCSHGKDRTGTLAFVLHGLLGVTLNDAKRDYGLAWFTNEDTTMTYTSINNLYNNLKNYDTASTKTFQGGCENYLLQCASLAGDTAGSTKIAAFKAAMLEDVETAAVNPELENASTVSSATVTYTTYPSPIFTVSGTVALGPGTTTATLHYSLNGTACDQTAALTLGEDGSFSYDIAYTGATDTLTWYVSVASVIDGSTVTDQTTPATLTRTKDTGNISYYWTGAAGDGKWSNIAN